ncbi:MAG: HD domain-containing phosphohydrolase [Candidatus Omnitrophota bacterium]|nr:HD domain-containing protein [Candidatus Omnitrophota bacterium]
MTKRLSDSAALWGLFFEKLLENIDAVVMAVNKKGEIIFVNRKYRDIFKITRRNTAGRNWINYMIGEPDRRDVRRIFSGIKKRGILCKFDAPVTMLKKETRIISWVSLPLVRKRTTAYMLIGRVGKKGSRYNVEEHALTPGELNEECEDIVDALFTASMESEPGTASHASRVMLFATALAKKLGLSKHRIERLKIASLLHDLGKLAIDEKVLMKKGKLNAKEYEQIKHHPHWGAEMINFIYFLKDIIPIMANHHENYDGTGYPEEKRGNRIPLESRILSVADIYEALIADRPYRKGFSRAEAIAIIKGEKGRKLDPKLTDIFLKMIKNKEI